MHNFLILRIFSVCNIHNTVDKVYSFESIGNHPCKSQKNYFLMNMKPIFVSKVFSRPSFIIFYRVHDFSMKSLFPICSMLTWVTSQCKHHRFAVFDVLSVTSGDGYAPLTWLGYAPLTWYIRPSHLVYTPLSPGIFC